MSIATAIQNAPVLCPGIQHKKLSLHGHDPANRQYCLERWAFVRDEWHSLECFFILDPASNKKRCSKCDNVNSNIRPSRFPRLYPASTDDDASTQPILSSAKSPAPTPPIDDLFFSNHDALQSRLQALIESVEDDADLSDNAELHRFGKALLLKGVHTFDIDDDRMFVACIGDGCDSCFVKKKRVNISTSCMRCKYNKANDKQYKARREHHCQCN